MLISGLIATLTVSTTKQLFQQQDPYTFAIVASTEASELLDIFRFRQPDEPEEVLDEKRDEVRGELTDTLYFPPIICNEAPPKTIKISVRRR